MSFRAPGCPVAPFRQLCTVFRRESDSGCQRFKKCGKMRYTYTCVYIREGVRGVMENSGSEFLYFLLFFSFLVLGRPARISAQLGTPKSLWAFKNDYPYRAGLITRGRGYSRQEP